MHNTMLLLLFVLFVNGVSGADPDETLSVIEGDSVTLHTGLTEILNDHTILWKFGPKGTFISQTTRKDNFTSFGYTDDVRFKGRSEVDQNTGSLTIRNTRDRHSGQYQLTISRGRTRLPPKTFNVTVQRAFSGTDGVKSKLVSVMTGETVTLNPDKTQIQGDDLMLWRFGDKGILLAKIDVETKETSLYDADEGFRDRLELDQTGSLTIRNTRTTDAGLYQLQLRGSESLQQFVLTVNKPGLSSGAKAGIGVGVLLCVAAAAAVGVIYHRRKISELQKQISTVKAGEDVTLKPNNKINKNDLIQWMFGDKKQQICLAEISGKPRKIVTHGYINVADGIFRGRLKLNETGSLTITDITTAHSGLYTLKMISCRRVSEQTFFVTVNETLEVKSVEDGDSVTLNPDTEIQGDDLMLWTFGYQYDLIAQIRGGTGEMYVEGAGEIFRSRLELNKTTGSLTIRNFTTQHIGLYKLLTISSRRGILCKKFWVFVQRRHDVIAGDPVYLSTDLTKIERDYVIEWRFGDENCLIAEIKGGTRETYDVPDGRFRDRLELDKGTGELTIKNFTAEHEGDYKLKIRSSEGDTNWTCSVAITGAAVTDEARGKSMTKGNNVGESVYVNTPLLDE